MAALKYPLHQEGKDKFAGRVNFTILQDQQSQSGADRINNPTPGDVISLYIPQGLTFGDGVNYTGSQIDPLFGEIALRTGRAVNNTGMTNVGEVADAIGEQLLDLGISQGDGGWVETIKGIARMGARQATRKGGRAILNNLGGDQLAGLIFGTVYNPNLKTTLEGVNIRTFTFQFQMIPTSKEEADAIAGIVKRFRTELYPAVEGLAGENLPVFLRYPNRFNIVVDTGGDEQHKIKFKPSFLTAVSTSYNPSSSTYHEDGAPTETTLNLTFTEESTLSKDDIADGGF